MQYGVERILTMLLALSNLVNEDLKSKPPIQRKVG